MFKLYWSVYQSVTRVVGELYWLVLEFILKKRGNRFR